MATEDTKEYAGKGWDPLRQTCSKTDAQYMRSRTAAPPRRTQRYHNILLIDARWSWQSGKIGSPYSFCYAPTNLSFPWEKRLAKEKDHTVDIAHHLAELTYNNQFYQDLHWSFVNRFPKLYHYTQQQALTRDAFKAVQAAKGSSIVSNKMPLKKKILRGPGPRSWTHNLLVPLSKVHLIIPRGRELVISPKILRCILILQTLQQLAGTKGSSFEDHIPPKILKTANVNIKKTALFARI